MIGNLWHTFLIDLIEDSIVGCPQLLFALGLGCVKYLDHLKKLSCV